MQHESPAIAIRRARFSESSLILTWVTPDHGKLQTSARGVLKHGSALSGRVDLFHESRIAWAPARRGEIHSLCEAEVACAFLPCPPGLAGLQAAGYFAALVDVVSQPGEPAAELFDLLQRALRYLRDTVPTPLAVAHFERRLAGCLGILDAGDPEAATRVLADYVGGLPKNRRPLLDILCATGDRLPVAAPYRSQEAVLS